MQNHWKFHKRIGNPLHAETQNLNPFKFHTFSINIFPQSQQIKRTTKRKKQLKPIRIPAKESRNLHQLELWSDSNGRFRTESNPKRSKILKKTQWDTVVMAQFTWDLWMKSYPNRKRRKNLIMLRELRRVCVALLDLQKRRGLSVKNLMNTPKNKV